MRSIKQVAHSMMSSYKPLRDIDVERDDIVTFDSLPNDVVQMIVEHIDDHVTLLTVMKLCRRVESYAREPKLWSTVIFGDESGRDFDWYLRKHFFGRKTPQPRTLPMCKIPQVCGMLSGAEAPKRVVVAISESIKDYARSKAMTDLFLKAEGMTHLYILLHRYSRGFLSMPLSQDLRHVEPEDTESWLPVSSLNTLLDDVLSSLSRTESVSQMRHSGRPWIHDFKNQPIVLPRVNKLVLVHCDLQFGDFESIVRSAPNLEFVKLVRVAVEGVIRDGFPCEHVRRLILESCRFQDGDLSLFVAKMVHLTVLEVYINHRTDRPSETQRSISGSHLKVIRYVCQGGTTRDLIRAAVFGKGLKIVLLEGFDNLSRQAAARLYPKARIFAGKDLSQPFHALLEGVGLNGPDAHGTDPYIFWSKG